MPQQSAIRVVRLASGTADLAARIVRRPRGPHALTERECEVLGYLAARPDQTVSRDELLARVFGQRGASLSRVVDTAISRLRSKIEDDPAAPVNVVSVFREGYRYVTPRHGERLPPERRGIPWEATPMVGRQRELAEVLAALADHRAVTLVGPGGVGKTRLAARVASEVDAERVWFVPVAHVTTAPELVYAVARSVGISLEGPWSQVAALVAQELDRRVSTVLVVDNLEQVREAGPVLDRWRASTAALRILATSRAPVATRCELVLRLDCLSPAEASALYIERAAAAGCPLDAAADSITALVSALDHLPLAIEIAASRARSMTPDQMRARMSDRLRLLARSGRGGADPRQSSLRATLDWSWELIAPGDRLALAMLSVFPTEASTEIVLDVLGPDGRDRLDRLVAASLVQRGARGDTVRLLETVRQWAHERADELGVRARAEVAHAERFLSWARAHLPTDAVLPMDGFDVLDAVLPHLLAIPARMGAVRPDLAVDVVEHLVEIAQVHGPSEPYLAAAEHAVAAARAGAPERLAMALNARASIRARIGAVDLAVDDLTEARGVAGDDATRAWIDSSEVAARALYGDTADALRRLSDAIPLLTGSRRLAALSTQSALRINAGDLGPRTEQLTRDALALATRYGRHIVAAGVRANLGLLLARTGRLGEAEEALHDAIAAHRRCGSMRHEVAAIASLAAVRLGQERTDDADSVAAEAEALARRTRYTQALAAIMSFRAMLELELGDREEGLRRIDEAAALVEAPTGEHGAIRVALLAALGRLSQAERALESLRAITDPEDELAVIAAAHLARARGDPTPALPPAAGALARYLARCLPEAG